MSPTFPFSTLVGQEELKLCLALAAVDWRLSCLIRGDKGSGKSTAARGLAEILPGAPPFVNVPIGVTEDRLLGGLNLEKAFEHSAALKPGLVHEAHGGVLYIDEVNLLAGHLTDALLDVSATGRYVLERDGSSQTYDSRFVLLGSMNPEEGSLRPQLLDRFALALDVHAPLDASDRIAILEARQRFDENPEAFRRDTEQDQIHWRESIAAARDRLADVNVGRDLLLAVTEAITADGVRSLRADLAAARAATALAALEQRTSVREEDSGKVLPLVLLHRAVNRPPSPPGPPPPTPDHAETGRQAETSRPQAIRVFTPERRTAPRLRKSPLNGTTGRPVSQPRGGADPERIDVFSSLQNSAKNTGDVVLRQEFVVNRRTKPNSPTRYVFAVDCSGSQAARQRMRAVKGVRSG